jgi:flagellar M-ring protein FliF
MPVDKFLRQIEAFVRRLTFRQKALLGVGVVLVVLVGGLFVRLTQTVDFKTLYSGLSQADAQAVVQRLTSKNIPYELSPDGTSVRVPADALDKTRLELASEGMPQSGRLGFELFDKPNWAGSDFSEQVNYQRALEGELERTIQTLGNVESVRVHLVLPHESLFSDHERVAKAAVVMKLRAGGLSDDQVNAVTHLVASAVDNLSPENVTLIGADGRTPLVAKGHEGLRGSFASVELEAAMAEKLVATLAPVVGPDHVKASVTVAYDQTSGDTTEETYDPDNPVLVSSQVQEERFGGAPPAGIPGTPSNVPVAPGNTPANGATTPGAGAGATPATPPAAATIPPATQAPGKTTGGQAQPGQNTNAQNNGLQPNALNPIVPMSPESGGQRSESRTYAVSKTLRHTIDPAGRVKKIAAAVLVDDVIEVKEERGQRQENRRKRTPEEMKQIEDAAKAAIGFDAGRGDVLSVQNISFLSAPWEKPVPTPAIERVRVVAEKWIWLVRYAILLLLFLLIYMLILRPVKNQLLHAFQQAAEVVASQHKLSTAVAAESGGQILPGASSQEFTEADLERELGQTTSEVQRVVHLKKHLTDKVKRDPGSASQLIRHWIHERPAH